MNSASFPQTPLDLRLMQLGAKLLLALFLLLVVAAGATALARSSWFTLRQIRIEGDVTHNNAVTIRANAVPKLAGNYLTMDLQTARGAFESVPWVRRAVVTRIWPHTLRVTLEEHQPVAFWERDDSDDALVNREGEVFEVNLGDIEDDDLPTLRGPRGTAAQVWAMYALLVPLFAGSGGKPDDRAAGKPAPRIDRLALSERGSWQVKLDTGSVIELGRGTPDEVVARTQRYVETVRQVTARFGDRRVEYADLRNTDGYALRMAGVGTTDPKAAKKR